jgi:colicin import membrane protein
MRLASADEPGRAVSGALAVLVHLIFFGLLVFGFSWQKKVAAPVMVDLWQDLPEPVKKSAPMEVLPKPVPRPAPPPKPLPPPPAPEVKPEPPAPPPAAPRLEAPKPSAAEIELKEKLRKQKEEEAERREEQKKAELEKRRLEEEQRKAAEEQRRVAEEQRREEAERKRAEQEKQRRDDEARRAEEQKRAEELKRVEEAKREEERRQHVIAMERERAQQEAVRKQREADEARRKAEAAARAAQQKVIDDWKARIQAKIRNRVVVPPNMEGNPEARFDVVLLPGGEVLNATLKKSSGSQAYDAAVERAIMAAQPLPVPNDTDLFQENFRELHLVFRPKD